jgi:hypothetical protein
MNNMRTKHEMFFETREKMPSNDNAMTVNERLYVAGLLDQFGSAAKSHSRDTMIQILMQVNISSEEATSIVDKILEAPGQYGY